jgi:hypothetical protein
VDAIALVLVAALLLLPVAGAAIWLYWHLAWKPLEDRLDGLLAADERVLWSGSAERRPSRLYVVTRARLLVLGPLGAHSSAHDAWTTAAVEADAPARLRFYGDGHPDVVFDELADARAARAQILELLGR